MVINSYRLSSYILTVAAFTVLVAGKVLIETFTVFFLAACLLTVTALH